MPTVSLSDFGPRICVLGPSNSGKSTLAAAVARARDMPVVHLDRLRHVPGSQWELRSDEEFAALHDQAIAGDRWVMDGNYSRLLDQRLDRATGLILLDASTSASVARYIRRTLTTTEPRIGGLEGATDRLSPSMLRFIVGPSRALRLRYRDEIFPNAEGVKVLLPNRRAINRFMAAHGLTRS